MKPFDLEKALAGEKVVTRDGREVSKVFYSEELETDYKVFVVVEGGLERFTIDGIHIANVESAYDLFMAPTKLSGFINVYTDDTITIHETKQSAKIDANCRVRKAFIDLSQFEEGHGL